MVEPNSNYEKLKKRVKKLEEEIIKKDQEIETLRGNPTGNGMQSEAKAYQADRIRVAGIQIEWKTERGTCAFEDLPVAMMWVDTTLAGLMSGVQAMVGTNRFGLALQREGRNSVEADWQVISQAKDFSEGFKAIARIAAVAGWGHWKLLSLDEGRRECRFRIRDSWEGRYQKALGVCWGSGMLAGKMAGYCSRLFQTNCWAEQTRFIAQGDEFDEFVVMPSERSIEKEIEGLLATDEATRADLAVAVEKLKKEIAEREQAEKDLRESEAKYRAILEGIEESYFEVDLAGNYTFFNDSTCKIMGYSRDELMGMNNRRYTSPQTAKKIFKVFNEVYRTGRPSKIREYEVITKDGSKRILELSAYLMREKEGQAIGFKGLGRDVTERRRVQQALEQSEERYRSLVENTMDGYFICEVPSGRFLFLNRRSCDLYGYTIKEAMGLTIWDVISSEDHGRIRARIRSRLERKSLTSARNTYTSVRKDGSAFRTEISSSLVTFRDRTAVQGVIRDVTEQERLEKQLQQVQRIEAIGTLAGGIAHDFNNLLMGIQGNASLMLLDLDASDPHYEKLKNIEKYVRNGADLSKQLLGFARGGRYEVVPADLNDLVKKSSEMFGRTKKEIRIFSKYQKDIWAVEVDRTQIEQVLLNLYVNSWQAMPGGGDLYLVTENIVLDENFVKPHQLNSGRYVKVSVTDTGIGMDAATQERIFDPFFTTKEMERGTGLGLASAYGIVKNHAGIINVYSEKGKGSTFNIYLPASERKAMKEKKDTEDILKGTETILLVDDEDMIIAVGREVITTLGYKVISAKSGEEAVALYRKNHETVDLVILDMIMPEMGGRETYEKLAAINPQVKVLLSSGYSINGEAEEILKRGCDGFIQKPFDLEELSQKIREILDKKAG